MAKHTEITKAASGTEALGQIQSSILMLRGRQVLLDFQLAAMYGVETRVLKQAVRRNSTRFPEDFMFQLTQDECNFLISNGGSQFVTPSGYNFGGYNPAQVFKVPNGAIRKKSLARALDIKPFGNATIKKKNNF